MVEPFVFFSSHLGMPWTSAAALSATFHASFALSYQQFSRFFDTTFASVKSPDVAPQSGDFGFRKRKPCLTFPMVALADLPAGA